MEYKARSVKGLKSEVNEDSYLLPSGKGLLLKKPNHSKKGHLFIVCDGMGGYKAGEIASRQCAKLIWEDFYYKSNDINNINKWIGNEIDDVNRRLFYLAAENEAYLGMGTTLVGVIINSGYAYVFNVGDSRCYFLSEGKLKQLTEDDSEVWHLFRRGLIEKDEIIESNRKHLITEAIATKPSVNYHLYEPVKLPEHYTLMLSSDGLHDVTLDSRIEELLNRKASAKKKCELLITEAIANKSNDDITVMVIEE